MAKYPLTPDYIAQLPTAGQQSMLALEEYLIKDICERLSVAGNITATAREHILALMRNGYDTTKIAKEIARLTGKAERDVLKALTDAINKAGSYYAGIYTACGAIFDPMALAADIEAIKRLTSGTMQNITGSLGFALRGADGRVKFYSPAAAYQKVLDEALIKTHNGISYNVAMRDAVRQLADSGIETVEYKREADGTVKTHVNRADVAVRRAVNTGVTHISRAYADQAVEDLHTPYIEVTAHSGARDKPGQTPWAAHKDWQGKIYSMHTSDKYPSVYETCGLDEVDGLCGANCRHTYHPFIPGVMQRTYTDQELQDLDNPPFVYNGKQYTQYAAAQMMRQTETTLRALKRRMIAFSSAGDREAYTTAAGRYRATVDAYKDFATAANLRNQMYDRAYIWEWGPKEEQAAEQALQAAQSSV